MSCESIRERNAIIILNIIVPMTFKFLVDIVVNNIFIILPPLLHPFDGTDVRKPYLNRGIRF